MSSSYEKHKFRFFTCEDFSSDICTGSSIKLKVEMLGAVLPITCRFLHQVTYRERSRSSQNGIFRQTSSFHIASFKFSKAKELEIRQPNSSPVIHTLYRTSCQVSQAIKSNCGTEGTIAKTKIPNRGPTPIT